VKDTTAANFADSLNAVLADGTDPAGPSLSPVRLSTLQRGDRVVLPSPNGSTCAAIAAELGARSVVAACLRNAQAVARWLRGQRGSVAVVACGERWPDESLRPALEDLLGAGAVVSALGGSRSLEAEASAALWHSFAPDVERLLRATASGLELEARGWSDDLMFACEVGASSCVPVLRDGTFTNAAG
jgi:2-phosphosulfolactate phosphatase